MKFTTRDLVNIAVFGTLWGLIEISLGTVLKSLNIPLSGMFLGAMGLLVVLAGRRFVPYWGATLFMGIVAMLLKLFSLGGVVIGPMVGIFSEALLAELVLSAAPRPNRLVFILAGMLGVVSAVIQPFVTGPLLFGRTILVVWLDLIDRASYLLGLDSRAIWIVLLVYTSIHLVVGGLAGWTAWDAGRLLQVRLGSAPAEAAQHLN
jgi:hypothetical protein